jgi:hypothetical protein
MVRLQRNLQQTFPYVLGLLLLAPSGASAQRFAPDDPLRRVPEVESAQQAQMQSINSLYDFVIHSIQYKTPPPTPSLAVNTLGEVPDSSWFTNRKPIHEMTIAELKLGARTHGGPQPPFTVVAAKTEGVTPGFRMRDARNVLFFVKVDPPSNPEMASAADVVAPLFLYAIGYNVPENYIFYARKEDIRLSEKATITGASGKQHRMTRVQLDTILDAMPRSRDGRMRFMGSMSIPGRIVGPFRYQGMRSDDPNDLVPHQQRRDLRGLGVIFAWLNHTDAKGENSLDSVVGSGSEARVKHFLLDFGDSFGSDSDIAKDPRHGQEDILPTSREQRNRAFDLGLKPANWETVRYPKELPAVGNFTAVGFDALKWKPNYPNPAFQAIQDGDGYWAARRVMEFSNEQIEAIVEEGHFSNPAVTAYMAKVLEERRDAIGRAWFARVLPLEDFAIEDGELKFTDLRARSGSSAEHAYHFDWFHFDNASNRSLDHFSANDARVPGEILAAKDGTYVGCTLTAPNVLHQSVTAYFVRRAGNWILVGLERTSPQSLG